jgi:hypothetical protein
LRSSINAIASFQQKPRTTMLDSPFVLLLLGISAAGAIASYSTARRRRRSSASPTLSSLSDQDLVTLFAALRTDVDPAATSVSIIAQQLASQSVEHPISGTRTASRMREADHLKSVSWVIERDREVRRRITVLVIEEIDRRRLGTLR